MEPFEALSFIYFVFDKSDEELIFQRWISGGMQFEMGFEEFKLRLKPKPIKSDDEIIEDVKLIINGFNARKGNLYGDI